MFDFILKHLYILIKYVLNKITVTQKIYYYFGNMYLEQLYFSNVCTHNNSFN